MAGLVFRPQLKWWGVFTAELLGAVGWPPFLSSVAVCLLAAYLPGPPCLCLVLVLVSALCPCLFGLLHCPWCSHLCLWVWLAICFGPAWCLRAWNGPRGRVLSSPGRPLVVMAMFIFWVCPGCCCALLWPGLSFGRAGQLQLACSSS